ADFPFVDLASGKEWTLSIGSGLFPGWIFDKRRRVPETRATDYLSLLHLLWAANDQPLEKVMNDSGPLYERLIAPFFLAALNIDPRRASSKLTATLMRETLALGGKACRPLMAPHGIGKAFVEPAVDYLRGRGAAVSFKKELIALRFSDGRVSELDF